VVLRQACLKPVGNRASEATMLPSGKADGFGCDRALRPVVAALAIIDATIVTKSRDPDGNPKVAIAFCKRRGRKSVFTIHG